MDQKKFYELPPSPLRTKTKKVDRRTRKALASAQQALRKFERKMEAESSNWVSQLGFSWRGTLR